MDPDLAQLLIRIQGNDTVRIRWVLIRNSSVKNAADLIVVPPQDLLGVMFSVNMLKVLRLPSLKICTCLLSALFFYDIFFVFITPLFMKDGKSVMVEVRRDQRDRQAIRRINLLAVLDTGTGSLPYRTHLQT